MSGCKGSLCNNFKRHPCPRGDDVQPGAMQESSKYALGLLAVYGGTMIAL